MNCKLLFYLFLGNKKSKMSNWFIPSNGVGELYLDVSDMQWYLHESSCYNIDKEIPFMKLLLDMASLRMRYYLQLNGNRLLLPQAILNLRYTSTMLTKSFIKIKSLSEVFFCTGDIQNLNYCMKVCSQFLNNEPFDFFLSGYWEIELSCWDVKRELDKFIVQLEKIFQTLFSLTPKNPKFRKNLNETKLLFKQDLIKQFTKFIFKDGKYSSGIYGMIEGIYLERMQYKYFFERIFERNFNN